MKGKVTYHKIYKAFYVLLSIWIGTQLLAPLIAPNLEVPALLLGGGITAVIFYGFLLTSGVQRLIPVISLTAMILAWMALIGREEGANLVTGYLNWVWGYDSGTGYELSNQLRYELVNSCLAGAVFLLFSLITERFVRLRLLTGVALAGYLVFGMITGRQLHKITVCLILLLLIACVTEYLQKRETNIRTIVYLLPFLLAFLVGLMILPESSEPYEWGFVKRIYSSAKELVIYLAQQADELFGGEGDGFGMAVTGFSGSGEIGDGVSEQNGNMLEMSLKSGERINIYLTGNVFDSFDGEQWETTLESTKNDHLFDLLETLYAVRRYDEENMYDYLYQAKIGITFTNMNTEYLFTPLKVAGVITTASWKEALREYGGEWRFSKKQGLGTGYDAVFYQMNMGQAYFTEMIEQESRYDYGENTQEEILSELTYLFNDPTVVVSEDELHKRSEAIKSLYAEKIGVSQEVKQFIDDITQDCVTDYEMCKAIEAVLSGSADHTFTYTVRPEQMPEGKVFPDYFLLESREGYCTYYATAFVIMARELGMPARYVQGFCVSGSELSKGTLTVTSGMAHAWPEVYFEGLGWLPFEPTPGYGSARYLSWQPRKQPSQVMLMPDGPEAELLPEELPEVPVSSAEEGRDSILLPVAGTAFLALVLSVILLAAARYFIRQYTYRRYTPLEKMYDNVRRNLAVLKYMGFRLSQGETIGEYRQRILQKDSEYPLDFIVDFEEVIYGNGWVSEEMIQSARQDKNLMLKKLKDVGRLRYYWVMMRMFSELRLRHVRSSR